MDDGNPSLQELLGGLVTMLRVEYNISVTRGHAAWLLAKALDTDVGDEVLLSVPRSGPKMFPIDPREQDQLREALMARAGREPRVTAGALRRGLGLVS